MIATEILDIGFIDVGSIDVDRVSAHIAVELIPVEFISVEAVAVRMVPPVETIRMVSTGVATVPGRVPVERIVVVNYRATRPITSPGVPPPAATCQRPDCNSSTE